MREIKLTPEEREEYIRLEKSIPFKGVAIRIRIILALDLGYTTREVADILLIDEDTVTTWKKRFLASKYVSDWLGNEYNGYVGKLSQKELDMVSKYVEEQVITDSKQVVSYIKSTFGIEYKVDGVTKMLHRLGFSYKQTAILPSKLDPEKQAAFQKQYEELKLKLKDGEKILFADGVHPTHNTHATRCWIKKGQEKYIQTNTGRERLNINGALDIKDMEITTHITERINAVTVMELFDKIQVRYDKATKIIVIVDNARYYKNKDVQAYLEKPGCRIELLFLPSYSPNLNFIERLWKFMRQKIIGVKYREKFKEFESDILQFFENFQSYEQELRPFIGTKFHLITP